MTTPVRCSIGVGWSDVAADGAAAASDLGRWEDEGRRAPSDGGAGFAAGYGTDLGQLADIGVVELRHTLEWARIEPTEGRRDVEALEHLHRVLAAAADAGIAVWACLQDTTLPGWFAHDERGFPDTRSRRYFWARHVEFVGETFGDLVQGWVPFFEPSRWAYRGHLSGSRPPGRIDDAESFAAHLEAAHLASVEAALRLRSGGRPVASAQWTVPLFPARPDPDSPPGAEAEAMTTVVDEALWGCWARMIDEETLQVPGRPPVAVPGSREAFDLIGITYRHAAAVRGDGVLLPYPQELSTGPDGQVPWPHGLELSIEHAADIFGDRPLLVAGYGITTGDEDQRAEHLRDGLAIIAAAVDDGIDLRGVWWDTPFDTSSGGAGPGLFTADRSARPAAELLAETAAGSSTPS